MTNNFCSQNNNKLRTGSHLIFSRVLTELTLFCLCRFWTYFFRKKLITKQVNCIFLGKICCQTVYCYGKFLKKSYRFFQFEISLRHASKQKISSFIPRIILQNIEGNGHWNSNHITFWVNLKLFKEGKTMRRAKYRHMTLPGVFLDNTRFWFYRWCSSSIRYSSYKNTFADDGDIQIRNKVWYQHWRYYF